MSESKTIQDDKPIENNYRGFDGYVNKEANLGMTKDANNLYSGGAYVRVERTKEELNAIYTSSWITGKAIDIIADDVTRSSIEMKGLEDADEVNEMQEALNELQVWAGLNEGLKWGNLYGGAINIIDIAGQDYEKPLNLDRVGIGQFRGLITLDRHMLKPSQSVVLDSKMRGTPEYYELDFSGYELSENKDLQGKKIHHSRVIRHIGIEVPPSMLPEVEFWGLPVIDRFIDQVHSFDATTLGVANLIQIAYLRIMKFTNLRELLANEAGFGQTFDNMIEFMRKYQRVAGITVMDNADEFVTHSFQFSGLSDLLLQFGQQVGGSVNIPLVRIFGMSPAGLNATGESDMRMHYDNIQAQANVKVKPGLLRILAVMYRSLFGKPLPQGFRVNFKNLWQLTDKEKAEAANQYAQAIVTLVGAGVLPAHVAMKELQELSNIIGIGGYLEDIDIENAKPIAPPSVEEIATIGGESFKLKLAKALEDNGDGA